MAACGASLAASRMKGGDLLAVTVIGWMVVGIYLIIMMTSPYLVYSLYAGNTWAAQPWLFGFEGHMQIERIETLIFGINLGRLR